MARMRTSSAFVSSKLTGSRSSPKHKSQFVFTVKLYSCSDPSLDLSAAVSHASLDASVAVKLCREYMTASEYIANDIIASCCTSAMLFSDGGAGFFVCRNLDG